MTDAGELTVRIKADAAQLESAMRKANTVVKQQAGGMADSFKDLKAQILSLAPALSVIAFVEFGKSAFEAADHINDLAQRTGFLGSTLSALNIPLKQGGSNLDEFAASMNRMNAMIGEAAKGTNQEAVKAFDGLGLSVKRLKALSPEQQFYEIAAALGKIKSQSELTEKGMNIFGMSFATLIPLIRDSKGNVGELIAKLKEMGLALTDEQFAKIDEMGDRWTAAIEKIRLKLLNLVPLFETLTNVPDYVRAALIDIPQQAGQGIVNYARTGSVRDPYGPNLPKGTVSTERPETVSQAQFQTQGPHTQYPLEEANKSAKGDNKALLTPPKDSQLKEYIANLNAETTAIGKNERALFVARAEIEAAAKAKEDFNNKLRASKALTDQEKPQIDQLAGKFYDLKKAQEEVARFQQELHDKLAQSLTDIVFKAGSATQAMRAFAQSIAEMIVQKKIAGPLADSLIGTNGKSGLLDSAISGVSSFLPKFFADGGSPPVGVPSIVGERGPEIFVPSTSGTIIPNHQMGGSTVIVQQTIQLSPGMPELINQRIREAAPVIAAQAQAGVFQAMQQGGGASKIIGARN